MKIAHIDPRVTPFRLNGRTVKVSSWSFYDRSTDDGAQREVWHYGTLMGVFEDIGQGWEFYPVSTGWGSVSDQQGMNKIMHGHGWYYSRKGGARYVRTV